MRENEISPTLQARMGTGGNQVPILMENIPGDVMSIVGGGQNDRKIQCLNPQFSQGEKIYLEDGIHPTLRSGSDAGGRGYPNAYVAQAYAIGNGQVNQLYLQDKCGTLNCMVDPMKVMQKIEDDNDG